MWQDLLLLLGSLTARLAWLCLRLCYLRLAWFNNDRGIDAPLGILHQHLRLAHRVKMILAQGREHRHDVLIRDAVGTLAQLSVLQHDASIEAVLMRINLNLLFHNSALLSVIMFRPFTKDAVDVGVGCLVLRIVLSHLLLHILLDGCVVADSLHGVHEFGNGIYL